MNSSNGFSGGTTLNGGTIYLNQYQAFGFGPLTLNGGTLSLGSSVKFYNAINVASNTFLNAGTLGGIGGAVTGGGNLNLAVSGTGNTFDISGDLSNYGGTLTVSNSNCFLRFNYNNYAVVDNSGASFNLGSGNTTLLNRNSGTFIFGGLSGGASTTLTGASTVAAPTYYFIGANNASTTFAGTISDNAGFTALTKTGTGTLTLAGNNTFSGGTTVNAGTLLINNTAGSGTGSGTVSVNPGATLGGNGTIAGQVSLAAGATLAPGGSAARHVEHRQRPRLEQFQQPPISGRHEQRLGCRDRRPHAGRHIEHQQRRRLRPRHLHAVHLRRRVERRHADHRRGAGRLWLHR